MATQARLLQRDGKMYLVQWAEGGMPMRTWVDHTQVSDDPSNPNRVLVENIDEGIPFGEDWAIILDAVSALPRGSIFALAMRESGIWNKGDALNNIPLVKQALQRAYADTFSSLMTQLTVEE